MISFYKWKKNAVFVTLGTIPLLIFMLVFFPTIKYYTYEGMNFMYIDPMNVVISFIAAVVTAIAIILFGNKTLQHAFTKLLEGKGLVTFTIDSTGIIECFNVGINAPKMFAKFKNRPDIEDTYDVEMMQRLVIPKDAPLTEAYKLEKDNNGQLKLGEKVDVLVFPKGDQKYEHLFAFDNRPVFIYNKVLGKFMSRDALAKYENDIEIKHNALNVLKKVQEMDITLRNFGRYIGEQLVPKKGGLFANPIIKFILIGIVVFVIVVIMLMFLAPLMSGGMNIIPQ